jgi:lipoprotein signal peptidase
MKGWWVTDPWIFYGIAGAIVAYVLYMMIRKRKGERSGVASHELEL